MLKIILVPFLIVLFFSCVPARVNNATAQIQTQLKNKQQGNQFTGLLVVDTHTKDTILTKNATKYFTPASTTKLFTFYAANKLLGKRIPSLKYFESNDTIYIQGTGDPSWLHPYFRDSTALIFLQNSKKTIIANLDNFEDEKFRPGWAWEDYQYYFSPELGPIPMYGNVATFYESDSLVISPTIFTSSIKRGKSNTLRILDRNEFLIPEILKDTLEIPFITSHELTKEFIQTKINKKITLLKPLKNRPYKVIYGISTDSIYKRMLYKSDNFLAEQLMLSASSTLSDTLSFNKTKDYILNNYLADLKQPPRWVDGSGLSRYNLFSPESMVVLLQKLYEEIDKKSLFRLMPAWDANRIIQETVLISDSYIHAKSGSFGNTYNLCGYLKTRSGKIFVFSYMNNHFRIPSKQVELQVAKTLKLIHDSY